jgi:exosortase
MRVLWWMWMNNPNYSHGFLIPPVTAWLLWRQRDAFTEAAPGGSWAGSFLLLPGAMFQVLGLRGDVAMLQGLALVLVLMGLVWQIFGGRVFARVAFPLLFLIFMIPTFPFVINVISFRLKLLAATGAVAMAQEVGVAVQREGVNLLLPDGVLAVENACSGLRSLIALLALGALFAYLSRGVIWRRIVLFLLAVPIAVIANVLRISGLCIYAGLTSVEQAAGAFHLVGGYVLFALAFLMLAGSKKVLRC